MIEVRGLKKTFDGFAALDGADLSVPRGAVYGLVGPNGAGKTTLLRHLTGVYRQDEGSVRFDGEEVWENADVKARIASIPDDWFYFMQAGLRDMMRFYRGFYPNFNLERYEKLKEVFALDETRPLRRMSKGQQKQAAFWLAMCTMPDYLILDEPVDGLDPVMRDDILDVFLDFVQDENHSILMSSHITTDLEKVADYITFIHQGKVLFCKTKDELRYNYGIIRCGAALFDQLDKAEILAYRKDDYQWNVLVADKEKARRKYKNAVVDDATIDDILLLYVKGEQAK